MCEGQLSRHLRAVEAGDEVTVTDRDRPIARIVPVLPRGTSAVVLGPTRDFAVGRDRTRVPAEWDISSTELLLEERLRTADGAIGFEVMT